MVDIAKLIAGMFLLSVLGVALVAFYGWALEIWNRRKK